MLVAGVVAFQLLIISGTLIGCFITYPKIENRVAGDERCSGENVTEIMALVVTQAFALYAAEK
jgi:hypothetical protein